MELVNTEVNDQEEDDANSIDSSSECLLGGMLNSDKDDNTVISDEFY